MNIDPEALNSTESWDAYIKLYHDQKTVEQKLPAIRRETAYDHKRKEREFDPIAQQYIDKQKEDDLRKKESETSLRATNRGRDKQLKWIQPYNIINLASQLDVPVPDDSYKRNYIMPDTRTPYNIVTGEAYPPEKVKEIKVWRNVDEENQHKFRNPDYARDFNIISNKYKQENTKKQEEDMKKNEEYLATQFWKTHQFNPVTQKYYYPGDEEKFKQAEEETKTHQGEKQWKNMPETAKKGEAAGYNIVSGVIKNPELTQQLDEDRLRGTYKYEVRPIVEKSQQYREEEMADLVETRTLNRYKDDRFNIERKRGYDIITNNRFTGISKTELPQLRSETQEFKQSLTQPLSVTLNRMKPIENPRKTLNMSRNQPPPSATCSSYSSYSSSCTATPMSHSTTRSSVPPQAVDIERKLAAVKTGGF